MSTVATMDTLMNSHLAPQCPGATLLRVTWQPNDKWWWWTDDAVTRTMMRAHLPHEWRRGPTTTTDEWQWGPPPPCTNSNEHPAPAHTQRGQDRDDNDDMAQWQMMMRLPHDAMMPTSNDDTTPTNDTPLGNDNMCKDDDKGHVPLAFYIPLPFI